jgi:pyruvate,water dikinase
VKRGIPLRPLAGADDERRFGGKAAGLARLARAGAPMPAGVVIDTAAFDRHVVRCGARDLARKLAAELPSLAYDELRRASGVVRESILRAPLEPRLAAQVREFAASTTPLAVRSSAIGEDAKQASFAGLFDTLLRVRSPEDACMAVRRVWASAYSERALCYSQRLGLRSASMAVILQEQVDALASGVLFTRDTSGDECMLIEFCDGLGDRLVGGELDPGRGRIRRTGLRVDIERRTEASACFDPLRHPAVRDLARHALSLERRFGAPQDIEWCIDRRGRALLLQCRPITGNAEASATEIWSNANIAENFPGPVCPFLRSFVTRGYTAYFRGLGHTLGIAADRMDAMADAFERLVGVHAGRLYYNLSNIHAVLHLAPGGAWLGRYFDHFTGARSAQSPRRIQRNPLARTTEAAAIALNVAWQCARLEKRLQRFERRVDSLAAQTAPHLLGEVSLAELGAHLDAFLDIRLRRWTDAALADAAAMVSFGILSTLLRRWLAVGDIEHTQTALLQGLPGLASAVPVERLWTLADRARDDPAARDALGREPAERALEALHATECTNFREALDAYLREWGFRYSGELMLTQPTPAETPLPVIRLLQAYLREGGPGPAAISAKRAREREAETLRVAALLTPSQMLRRLPLPTRAACLRTVLWATQRAIRLRERARMKQALLYTRLRHIALAIGDRLAALGVLTQRDDVFYLEIDEAIALAKGSVPSASALRATIAARRGELASAESCSPPDTLSVARGATWEPPVGSDTRPDGACDGVLKGVGASAGMVAGKAAVVLDVTSAGSLGSGCVLVTRQTDPGWATVFFLARGLVVERGGMLSHGAIIAREYGIPAVIGIRDATRLIRDGEMLRVDGSTGVVERQRA